MINRRLYVMLCVFEAIVVLKVTDQLYPWLEGFLTGPYEISHGSWCDLLLACPAIVALGTNVIAWYLFRKDDWQGLGLRSKLIRTAIVSAIAIVLFFGFYEAFLAASPLHYPGIVAVLIGLLLGLACGFALEAASSPLPNSMPRSLSWLGNPSGSIEKAGENIDE